MPVDACHGRPTARRSRYLPALRAANERRIAEATSRRATEGVATTPYGQRSRAKYTPEKRRAHRSATMRAANANHNIVIRDLIAIDIDEAPARPRSARGERIEVGPSLS